MRKIFGPLASAVALAALTVPVGAQDVGDGDIASIVDEGMNRSHVMLTIAEITDQIGPRLTNSPNMRRAEQWALDRFSALGLANPHREGFDFGRGWEIVSSDVRMVSPRPIELTAIPIAWSPPTDGTLQAEIIVAPISKEEHFDAYRGKLRGKIVLIDLPGTGDTPERPAFRRLGNDDLGKLDQYDQPDFDPDGLDRRLERVRYAKKLDAFLAAEGAAAVVKKSYRDGKLLHGSGYNFRADDTISLPAIEVAAEDYRRLARLAKVGPAPVLAINSNVRFHDEDMQAYNIIAEIPGSDPKAGYVMAGAHFDSWAAGDGAVDNGAGSAAVIEAARLIKAMGTRPKRTIRFVLWAGEEQGLLGSRAYVERHLATRQGSRGEGMESFYSWPYSYPIVPKPGHSELKAYFNMDNGSGRFRGIYAEGNTAAVPLLRKWLAPFASMDAGRVVAGPTGGTDHVFMQQVGIPAFQFIQDPLDYGARLHHTNIDTFDHVQADDMRQAAVVMAGVLWQAANDDKTLPRQPLPTQPDATDPFKYSYPDAD